MILELLCIKIENKVLDLARPRQIVRFNALVNSRIHVLRQVLPELIQIMSGFEASLEDADRVQPLILETYYVT